jgi:hypothetical protein
MVAAASGLRGEDRILVRELVKEWSDHYERNLKRHCYYVMHNRLVDLGISIPPKLRNLDAACGWAQKTVDVMVEHSIFDGYTVGDDEAQAQLDAITRRNKMRSKYRKATTSALEQGFNLYFVSRGDDGHAHVSAYPAHACGVTWDDANDTIKAALFVVDTKKDRTTGKTVPTWVNVVTPEYLIRIKSDMGRWYVERYEPHGLGHLPVFLAAYNATLERPFGQSRITREVMGYIDSAVRANINEEIASAFAASSQKYLLGTDGDPFEDVDRWQAFIGAIFNIDMTQDGTVPQFGQLPQPSMQPLTDHFRNLCAKMSAATGIHVSQFGLVHDQPSSAEAIYAENSPLIRKVKAWHSDVGDTLTDVAIACLATERGTTFDSVDASGLEVQPRFMNPSMPTLAQMTDASVKIASVVPAFANTPTFWRQNGYSDEEVTTVMRELQDATARETTSALAKSIFGGSDAGGVENG